MINRDREEKPIAILYEHPEWFKPLFAELDQRGIPYELWPAHEHCYDPQVRDLPHSLVINRMSPSSYLREHGNAIFYTRQLLAYLKNIGVPVINPYEAFVVETSKTLQIEILEQLRLRYPRTRIINHASLALDAAEGLEYPIVLKPNIGGSGARIQKFDSREELRRALATRSLDLGFDSTALVQEYLPAHESAIVRVEVLDGKFLYAIKIITQQNGNFNLCPADICQDEKENGESTPSEISMKESYDAGQFVTPEASGPQGEKFSRCVATAGTEKRRLHIEKITPPSDVIEAALRIARRAQLDVGGIEFLVNERDGQVYFYDINALSNFVTDATRVVGFNPYERFVDFVLQRTLQTAQRN